MAFYGSLIDEFASVNDNIYTMFTNYFNNPIMTKIKNEDKYSMYYTKSYCLLSKECRYIIVITDMDDYPLGTENQMKNLKWISLQTRTLFEQYDIKSHGYTPIAQGPLLAHIYKEKKDEYATTYICKDLPLVVTLLHTERKNADSYQAKGTIIAALETWETIITFNEK
jgi:hypothetical protein